LEIQAAWQEVESDFAAGLLVGRGGLWHRVLVDAETSALNDTPIIGSRTLDVLHVTAAKLIGVTEFCTFDTRQAALASRVGLTAVTP
jgi:predicted nucleic acid-binding protein